MFDEYGNQVMSLGEKIEYLLLAIAFFIIVPLGVIAYIISVLALK